MSINPWVLRRRGAGSSGQPSSGIAPVTVLDDTAYVQSLIDAGATALPARTLWLPKGGLNLGTSRSGTTLTATKPVVGGARIGGWQRLKLSEVEGDHPNLFGWKLSPGLVQQLYWCDASDALEGVGTSHLVELFHGHELQPVATYPRGGAWQDVSGAFPIFDDGQQGGNQNDTAGFMFATDSSITGWPALDITNIGVQAWTSEYAAASGMLAQIAVDHAQVAYYLGQIGRFGSGRRNAAFRLLNIPTGLASEGDYWIDRRAKRVYWLPSAAWKKTATRETTWLSTCPDPLLSLDNCSNVTISANLLGGLGHGAVALSTSGCDDVTFSGSIIGAAGNGIVCGLASGGTVFLIGAANRLIAQDVVFQDIGGSAVHAYGGDRLNRVAGAPTVRRFTASNLGRRRRDAYGFCLMGMAPRIEDGTIARTNFAAVSFQHPYGHDGGIGWYAGSNDALYQRIRFTNCAYDSSDMGAVYPGGRSWIDVGHLGQDCTFTFDRPRTGQGTGQTAYDIYLDDGLSLQTIRRCRFSQGFQGVAINGGFSNSLSSNRVEGEAWSVGLTKRLEKGDVNSMHVWIRKNSGSAVIYNEIVSAFGIPAVGQTLGSVLPTAWRTAYPALAAMLDLYVPSNDTNNAAAPNEPGSGAALGYGSPTGCTIDGTVIVGMGGSRFLSIDSGNFAAVASWPIEGGIGSIAPTNTDVTGTNPGGGPTSEPTGVPSPPAYTI